MSIFDFNRMRFCMQAESPFRTLCMYHQQAIQDDRISLRLCGGVSICTPFLGNLIRRYSLSWKSKFLPNCLITNHRTSAVPHDPVPTLPWKGHFNQVERNERRILFLVPQYFDFHFYVEQTAKAAKGTNPRHDPSAHAKSFLGFLLNRYFQPSPRICRVPLASVKGEKEVMGVYSLEISKRLMLWAQPPTSIC